MGMGGDIFNNLQSEAPYYPMTPLLSDAPLLSDDKEYVS